MRRLKSGLVKRDLWMDSSLSISRSLNRTGLRFLGKVQDAGIEENPYWGAPQNSRFRTGS